MYTCCLLVERQLPVFAGITDHADEKPFEGVRRRTAAPLVSLSSQQPIAEHSFVGDVLNTYTRTGAAEGARILDMLAECSSSSSNYCNFYISVSLVCVQPSLFFVGVRWPIAFSVSPQPLLPPPRYEQMLPTARSSLLGWNGISFMSIPMVITRSDQIGML